MNWAQAGIAAAMPTHAVQQHLGYADGHLHFADQHWDLQNNRGVWVLCAGKAAIPMAQGIVQTLPAPPVQALVITREGQGEPVSGCTVVEAGHPLSNAASDAAGQQALACARAAGAAGGLLLCGISGGASALLASPRPGISIQQMQDFSQSLLASGADISVVNAMRRRCLQCAGGGLAAAARGAQVWAMLVSDVANDCLADIGSGPLCVDPTRDDSATELAARAGLILPANIAAVIDATPSYQAEAAASEGIYQRVIAGNRVALAAIAAAAQPRKVAYGNDLSGEATQAAADFVASALSMGPDMVLISGGETTVTLGANPGQGGRNQEFALAAARAMSGHPSLRLLALGSDGSDGPTDAAGGLVDGTTWPRLCAAWGQDGAERALREHNAYPALEAVGALIRTGPTHTNVADFVIAYHHRGSP